MLPKLQRPWAFKPRKRQARRGHTRAFLRPAILLLLPLVLVACQSAAPTPTPTATPIPTPTPPATPTPTPTLTPTPQPLLQETLFLEIAEPANESIVTTSPVIVNGKTTPDAVVSVNEKTAEVNAQGDFVVPVFVDPGPNLIEVVASDLDGNQETAILAIIYLP